MRTLLIGLILTALAWSQPVSDKVEVTRASTGFAGTLGEGLRVFADGRVEEFHFKNGKSEVTRTGHLEAAAAQALIQRMYGLQVVAVKQHAQGFSQSLTVIENGRTRRVSYKRESDAAVQEILEPARRSLREEASSP